MAIIYFDRKKRTLSLVHYVLIACAAFGITAYFVTGDDETEKSRIPTTPVSAVQIPPQSRSLLAYPNYQEPEREQNEAKVSTDLERPRALLSDQSRESERCSPGLMREGLCAKYR